jgi:hypothetical protein
VESTIRNREFEDGRFGLEFGLLIWKIFYSDFLSTPFCR